MKIKIEYDGEHPVLCGGNLKITIDGKDWDFGKHSIVSGGTAPCNETITTGPWSVCCWPENFPENLKNVVINEINKQIRWGCCGGCR